MTEEERQAALAALAQGTMWEGLQLEPGLMSNEQLQAPLVPPSPLLEPAAPAPPQQPAGAPQAGDLGVQTDPHTLQTVQSHGNVATSSFGPEFTVDFEPGGSGGRRQAPAAAQLTLRPGPLDLPGMQDAYAMQAEGLTGMAIADAEHQLQQAALFDEQAEGDRIVREHFARVSAEHDQAAQQEVRQLAHLIDEIEANRVDPNRMFAGPGGASARLGAAAAIAGGFISSVYTQQPNAALDIINRAIERDIQAQVANQGQQGRALQGRLSLIDAMRNAYHDETSAILAARTIRLQEAATRLKALQSRTANAQAASNLQNVLGQLRFQMLSNMDEFQSRQWEIRTAMDPQLVPSFVNGMREQQLADRRMQVAQQAADSLTAAQVAQDLGGQAPAQETLQAPPGAPQAPAAGGAATPLPGTPPNRPRTAPRGPSAQMPPQAPAGPVPPAQDPTLPRLPAGYQWGNATVTPPGMEPLPIPLQNRYGRLIPDREMFRRVWGMQLTERTPEHVRAESAQLRPRPASTLPGGDHVRFTEGGEGVWTEALGTPSGQDLQRILNTWHTYEDNVGTLLRDMNSETFSWTPEAIEQNSAAMSLTGLAQVLRKLARPDAMAISEQDALLVEIMGGHPGRLARDAQVRRLRTWFRNAGITVQNWARSSGLQWSPPGTSAERAEAVGAERTESSNSGSDTPMFSEDIVRQRAEENRAARERGDE